MGAILLALLLHYRPAYSLEYTLSAVHAQEGEPVTAHLTITAHTPLPVIVIAEFLPPAVTLSSGASQIVLSLKAGESAVIEYTLLCQQRERVHLGNIHVQGGHFPHLFFYEALHLTSRSLVIYPKISKLHRGLFPHRTQVYAGNYPSRSYGEGIEYGNTREYVPGDNVRRMNWRVSQKWSRLHVNEYTYERNADVIIMIDSLTSIGDHTLNTLDLSVQGAASLVQYYLQRKDRVGFIDYGGMFRWVKPAMGQKQFYRIMDRLLETQVTFSYVSKDITLVPKRILPPGAMVIVFSPLIDQRILRTVGDLVVRKFDVSLIIPSPALILARLLPDTPTNALASQFWRLRYGQAITRLRQLGIGIVEWDGEISLENVLASLRRTRQRIKRIG
jgi:uncharacterized protein (DUF58 family)